MSDNNVGRFRKDSSINRRSLLKRTGALGAGFGVLGLSGIGQANAAGYEMELGERHRLHDSGSAYDDSRNLTFYADNSWGLTWTDVDDSTYRFTVVGLFHTYREYDGGDVYPVGWQEAVDLDVTLDNVSDSNMSNVYTFDDNTTISGWNGQPWREWYNEEKGNEYSEWEIENALQDKDFTSDASHWYDAAVMVGGLAMSSNPLTGALSVGSYAIGGLKLANSIGERFGDDCEHESTDDPHRMARHWDFGCYNPALTLHISEFHVNVGDEYLVDADITQTMSPSGSAYGMTGADNEGGWKVRVLNDHPPKVMSRYTR